MNIDSANPEGLNSIELQLVLHRINIRAICCEQTCHSLGSQHERSGTDGELTEDKWWKVIQYNHKDQTLSPSEIWGGAVKYCAKSSVIIFETSAVALSASSLEL